VYVQIIRKVLACIRRECYNEVQSSLKRDYKERMGKDEFDEILKNIADNSQEKYRGAALTLFKVDVPEESTPMKTMQKAYLVYSTVSSIKHTTGTTHTRSRW
jgi:hypothetical protein